MYDPLIAFQAIAHAVLAGGFTALERLYVQRNDIFDQVTHWGLRQVPLVVLQKLYRTYRYWRLFS